MTDFLHAPGFLGTNAHFAADMTLVLSILVALIFTFGAYLAKRAQGIERRFPAGDTRLTQATRLFARHRWIQTLGAVTNIILVLWLMILPYRDFVLRDTGGPRVSTFYVITTVHAVVGLFAFAAVILTVFGYAFLNKRYFKGHNRTDPVWLGLHAALIGGLAAGIFDHYLFNLEFHHAVTIFWLIVGLATAATRVGAELAKETADTVSIDS